MKGTREEIYKTRYGPSFLLEVEDEDRGKEKQEKRESERLRRRGSEREKRERERERASVDAMRLPLLSPALAASPARTEEREREREGREGEAQRVGSRLPSSRSRLLPERLPLRSPPQLHARESDFNFAKYRNKLGKSCIDGPELGPGIRSRWPLAGSRGLLMR